MHRLAKLLIIVVVSGAGATSFIQATSALGPQDPARLEVTDLSAGFDAGSKQFQTGLAARGRGEPIEAKRRFRHAARAFSSLFDAGHTSVELAVNTANSFAFAGDTAAAILWYRRALYLAPSNERALSGLSSQRATLPIRPPARTTESLVRTLFFWHSSFSLELRWQLLWLCHAACWLLIALFLVRRKPLKLVGIAALLLGATAALYVSVSLSHAQIAESEQAVVLAVQTSGHTGNNAMYSASHDAPLPAGTEGTVIERRNTWLQLRLLDGSSTWVKAGSLMWVEPRQRP